MKKQQMILIMGGQGVGKGTISRMLMAQQPYKYIETGAILRSMPADSDVAKIISAGNLVPDEILFDVIRAEIPVDNDVIIDGFPSKVSQAQWLVDNYTEMFDVYALYLSVPTDVLIQRINKRIREGANRKDDASPEIIRRRLDNFFNITIPAIDWLRNAPGVRFAQIDARGTIDDNFADILSVLQK
jgi:adenylate kinase